MFKGAFCDLPKFTVDCLTMVAKLGRKKRNGAKPNPKRTSNKKKRSTRKARPLRSIARRAFNALDPYHLPLARATGPYTVWRSSTQFQTNSPVVILGVFRAMSDTAAVGPNSPVWANTCAVYSNAIGAAINAALGTTAIGYDFSGIGGDNTAVLAPAAATFQVRCPTALLNAAGTVYGTRMKSDLSLAGSTRTWSQLATQIFSTQSMRAMTAAQLCTKGVKVDLLPVDLAEVEDFRAVGTLANGSFTWDGTGDPNWHDFLAPSGFAPAVIYNPTNAVLDFVCTTEWRLRFDPSNPGAAGHMVFPAASPGVWNGIVTEGHALAESGFEDIEYVAQGADRVAKVAASVAGVGLMAGAL